MKTKLLLLCVAGLLVALTRAQAATHYVDAASTNPVPPYADWPTAAAAIQDAVDAALAGDEIVVTNGVYQTGARAVYGMSNRVAVTKAVTVRSVNGPEVTRIIGSGPTGPNAVRCVYLTNAATLAGFTLTNGVTQTTKATEEGNPASNAGGGVWCESQSAVVTNCILAGNTAFKGAGAYSGTLNHCTLTGNSAIPTIYASIAGGAFGSALNNCTLTGNRADLGGGAYSSALTNCTLIGNLATDVGGGAFKSTLFDCILTGNMASNSPSTSYTGGGGACDCTLYNCTLIGNSATGAGGGAYGSTLFNCTLTSNMASNSPWTSATDGGGAFVCTLSNCTLVGNWADWGGGASESTLNNCMLTGNVARQDGGGALWSTLNNCMLTNNSAWDSGAGASRSTLNNCLVVGNSALESGGGAHASFVNNCKVISNTSRFGGGVAGSTLNNCTVTGNAALLDGGGGGAYRGTLNNCIVYHNTANSGGANHDDSTLNYSCTTPAPGSGVGNITSEPAFVDLAGGNLRLQSNSPCINAGHNAYLTGNTDLDGHPRIAGGAVDIGAFEWQGTTRYVSAASTNPIAPYSSWEFAAVTIQDAVDAAAPGDEIVVTNGVYQTGARDVYGMNTRVAVTKLVTVRSVNGPAVTSIVGSGPNSPEPSRCVYLTNGAVLFGFTLTNGAATGGSYIDGCGGGAWCEGPGAVLSNCVVIRCWSYDNGGGVFSGTLNMCLLAENDAFYGGGAFSSILNNCTLTGNLAESGGGVYSSSLTNCILSGNRAYDGGGAASSTLNNCTITGNRGRSGSASLGGGALECVLINCTLTGNIGENGGGAALSTLTNCIAYYNGGENYYVSAFNHSCTTPAPGIGVGNIISEPAFVDLAGGNLRLQSNSPCINAGHNAYVVASTDLDGRPRLVGGVVDMGTYEYQGPGTGEFIGWLQQFGLPTDGSADDVDTDHDGHNNRQEWLAGTNPTNAQSALWLASPVTTPTNVTLTWTSVTNRTYTLEQATNLGGAPAFSVLRSNLAGLPGTTSWTDTNAPVSSPRFYQLRVSP